MKPLRRFFLYTQTSKSQAEPCGKHTPRETRSARQTSPSASATFIAASRLSSIIIIIIISSAAITQRKEEVNYVYNKRDTDERKKQEHARAILRVVVAVRLWCAGVWVCVVCCVCIVYVFLCIWSLIEIVLCVSVMCVRCPSVVWRWRLMFALALYLYSENMSISLSASAWADWAVSGELHRRSRQGCQFCF